MQSTLGINENHVKSVGGEGSSRSQQNGSIRGQARNWKGISVISKKKPNGSEMYTKEREKHHFQLTEGRGGVLTRDGWVIQQQSLLF